MKRKLILLMLLPCLVTGCTTYYRYEEYCYRSVGKLTVVPSQFKIGVYIDNTRKILDGIFIYREVSKEPYYLNINITSDIPVSEPIEIVSIKITSGMAESKRILPTKTNPLKAYFSKPPHTDVKYYSANLSIPLKDLLVYVEDSKFNLELDMILPGTDKVQKVKLQFISREWIEGIDFFTRMVYMT